MIDFDSLSIVASCNLERILFRLVTADIWLVTSYLGSEADFGLTSDQCWSEGASMINR